MNNPGYLLASGPELERLRLQAKMWEPEAERCLDLVGIRDGWHCIDLGCGAQGVLEPLSRRSWKRFAGAAATSTPDAGCTRCGGSRDSKTSKCAAPS